jgi:hypothetical protein
MIREHREQPGRAEPSARAHQRRADAAGLLELQRSAGNRAVAQQIAAAVQRAKVAHTTGAQVDAYAEASPFLKAYVAVKIKGGTKADGHVHIHTAADFTKEWVAYAMRRTDPATGAVHTKAAAEAKEPRIICAEQTITRGPFYAMERGAVEKLVAATSREALAAAYFDGDLKGLENAVEAKAKGAWAQWLDFMKRGKYTDANALW